MSFIDDRLQEAIDAYTALRNSSFSSILEEMGKHLVTVLKNGGTIFIAGNGGSAADAQHFAAELSGRFIVERKGLSAIALTTNTSVLTAIGNDFGYEHVFSRQLEGLAKKGDIFIGISTSGNSKNIVEAMRYARENGITTMGLLGKEGGVLKGFCDIALIVPSQSTQTIQEMHIFAIHLLCQIIDSAYTGV